MTIIILQILIFPSNINPLMDVTHRHDPNHDKYKIQGESWRGGRLHFKLDIILALPPTLLQKFTLMQKSTFALLHARFASAIMGKSCMVE